MPTKPTAMSHQICQMAAKPKTKANTAMEKPAAVFFGMWIGW